MGNQIKVYCVNLRRYLDIAGGETLLDLYNRIKGELGFSPICARVNNKNESLRFPVFLPKQVEFMALESASGHRVYIRSLCMTLYKAVHDLYPTATLDIEHSISRGWYFVLPGGPEPSKEVADALKARMKEIVEADLPFERKERLTKDVIEIFRREGLEDKVRLLSTIDDLYTTYYKLDDVFDSYYGCLAPSTGYLDVFDVIPYEDGFLLLGPDTKDPSRPSRPIEQKKMYRAFTDHLKFNKIVGVSNVGELNEAVRKNETPMIINVSEALHEKYIGRIADDIADRFRRGGARVVLIAGPSSSGKTTSTKRLAIHLMTNLLEPKMISLDNYFVDRDKTPRDVDGDYEYESLYALNLEQFNRNLNDLIAGKRVEIPYYNFEKGKSEYRGDYLQLDENSVLLIEGIHGLNPALTPDVDPKMKYLVYISALTAISIDDHNWIPTTDNRLLRRIIRDYKYRGMSPVATLKRWASVRRGEEKWIFPFQENADATFNSSLLYELGVIRDQALKALAEVPRDIPEYAEAYRLRRFLDYFLPIDPRFIPSTSLLREFLGGSSFHY